MLRSIRLLTLRLRGIVPVLAVVPFALVACGDDDDGSSSRDGGTDTGSRSDSGPGNDGSPNTDGGVDGGGDGSVTPDTTAPKVASTSPAPSATGEPISTIVTANFDEAMDPLSLNDTTFTLTRDGVAVPGTVVPLDNTVAFTPNADLALDATYVALITTGAKDLAGNALAMNHTWSFKTDASARVGPAPVLLGSAANYVILAESTVTNAPTSKITGNLGLSPAAGSFYTGFALTRAGTKFTSAQVTGSLFAADNDPPTPSNLTTAIGAMRTAYTDAAGRPLPDFLNFDAGALGGNPLTPGLYNWTTAVTIPNDMTISGGANDVWIFQVNGDVSIAAAKKMIMANGARPKNVFWQVTGLVDIGANAHAEGVFLSKTLIKTGGGSSVNGRLFAQTAVNLAMTTVTKP